MKYKSTRFPALLCLCVAGLIASAFATRTPVPDVQALELGKLNTVERPVPAFSMKDLESATWNPAGLKGHVTIVNFWATWCAPCREEMPSLNRAWDKVKDTGVQMLAINIGDTEPNILRFLEEVPIDFTVLRATDAKELNNWGVRGLPTTLVVDSEANVVMELVGPAEWDQDELLQPVLDLLE